VTMCDVPGCQEHYGCRLRHKGIMVDPRATPNRRNKKPGQGSNPAWERGLVTETRRDGSVMPVLAPGTTRPLGVKELADNRSSITTALNRARQGV
jgi:hypothetical protein